ncbi:type II toxin-antitoxin system mRNA interferase toxin, RelE/StbE family [Patescibacteria group bacterium]|nr:type II toxin-antitoxin system mRNA interferase toxin, RelE/StbE family [Patescibacteria group bacterium]
MLEITEIHYTHDFKKAYQKLPKNIQKLVDKKDALFRKNPFYLTLNTHKLKGPLQGLWSFSVNFSYRILFEFLNKNSAIFYDVGTHEIYE